MKLEIFHMFIRHFIFFFSIVPVQDLAHFSVVSIFPIDLEQWFKYSLSNPLLIICIKTYFPMFSVIFVGQ